MTARRARRPTSAFAAAAAPGPAEKYVLRLYVAGASARSRQAVERVRRMCEAELEGSCELEVIDVYQQPILARDGQIVATPTLVRELPKPVRKFIGNLASNTRLFVGLDLGTKGSNGR